MERPLQNRRAMIIAFTTLFLGLSTGVHPVEVTVSDAVASVEVLLDGRVAATIEGEPWRASCDFGPELAPRILEAVAYDAERREIGRAAQVVNLPHPPAQASFMVDTEPETGTSIARLAWESRFGGEPRSVSAWLDGQTLEVEDPSNIVLPPHDRRSLHLFSAELEFSDHVSAQVMGTFGGVFADEVQSELTAMPILLERKTKKPPALDAMRGWFVKDGEPLEPVTVEKGRAEIVMVLGAPSVSDPTAARYSGAMPLKKVALRFLLPDVHQSAGVGTTFNLFNMSPEYDDTDGGFYRLLTRIRFDGTGAGERRLADAVAVAGLAAYERSYRRAVILLLDRAGEDSSLITAEQSRRYLERLRVPFVLWTTAEKRATLGGWGEPVSVSRITRLAEAFDDVQRLLKRQWIVWFEGRHLPQEIELSAEAEGVELAGSAP